MLAISLMGMVKGLPKVSATIQMTLFEAEKAICSVKSCIKISPCATLLSFASKLAFISSRMKRQHVHATIQLRKLQHANQHRPICLTLEG